jgi:hypothetical protein
MDLLAFVQCPRCHGRLTFSDGAYVCAACGPFMSIAGQPVLVDFDNSILDRDGFKVREGASPIPRNRRPPLLKRVLKGTNKAAEKAVRELNERLGPGGRILVVGGAVAGSGADRLYDSGLEVVGTDIYPTALTRVIADAHELPFLDESFDAVWIQAVLEHVLNPDVVVAEIHRVLRPDGLVFADTPFMQAVHEAAYDFTRFTKSGHRWLFRRFDEIESGGTGGPGTSLIWSLKYFLRATTGSSAIGIAGANLFFWLRFFDRKGRKHYDAGAGFYFFGRKSERVLSPREMVAYYDQM